MAESEKHKILKARAKEWLFGRNFNPIREEVAFFEGKLIIDVVGYKNGRISIGIECGNLHKSSESIYKLLPFPVYKLSYPIIERHPSQISRYLGIPDRKLGEMEFISCPVDNCYKCSFVDCINHPK